MAGDLCNMLLLLALLASATGKLILHDIDQKISYLNDVITHEAEALQELQEFSLNGVLFSKGYLYGLNTLERDNDTAAPLEKDGEDTYTLDIGLRYRLLRLVFPRLKMEGIELSASFDLPQNRARFGFTLHKGPECTPLLDELLFTDLGDIQLETSRPVDKATELKLKKVVRPYLNSMLDGLNDYIISILRELC